MEIKMSKIKYLLSLLLFPMKLVFRGHKFTRLHEQIRQTMTSQMISIIGKYLTTDDVFSRSRYP